jgi:uncharacterized membrane protein HdeD (DUF308 family)
MVASLDVEGGVEPRAWRMVLGIVMAVLGAIAIYTARVTGMLSVIIAGTALGVAGFVEILSGLGRSSKQVQPLRVIGGLLSMAVGVLFVLRPQTGLTGLTMMLAAYFIAAGLFHAATSLLERYSGWGWDLLYGGCAIVLGIISVSGMRTSGFWLVGTLVGIEIALRGLALTFGGLQRGPRRRQQTRATPLKHA